MSTAVIGIDLGTANSCVATVKDGRAQVLSDGANRTVPSCLAFSKGKEIVGHAARRQAATDPHNTVAAVKRLMGHPYESPEVQAARDRVAYPIRPSPLGSVMLEVGGRDLTPVQVSARVLQKVKEVAERGLGHDVSRAVISVPAHFNDLQRKATKLAAEYAGLDVLRLVNEPTAAAFAYGYRRGEDFTLAVYDLGGGTFDITVMGATGDSFQVIATDGDSYLGGDDFDHLITDWLHEQFVEEFGQELKGDAAAMLRLKGAAEHAKIELSEVEEARIELPFLTELADGSRPTFARTMTRAQLEELCGPIVERTLEMCHRCLDEAGVPAAALDEVLLVGGQSRMPMVRERVKEFFGREARRDINPDEVVAMGAALYAYSLSADDLQEEAEDAADDAFAIALKGSQLARKVVQGLEHLDAASMDLPELKERLQQLLAQAEDLPAERGDGPSTSDSVPSFDFSSTLTGTDDFDTGDDSLIMRNDDHDLPGEAAGLPQQRQATARDLPEEAPKLPRERRANKHDFPHAVSGLREELEQLSGKAQAAIGRLAHEIKKDGGEAKPDVIEFSEDLEKLSEQLSDHLSAGLENAAENTAEAQEHLEEAHEHKKARRIDLVDVTSLALGIASTSDLFTVLIEHNTRVPSDKTRVFTTNQENQAEVQISVRQGRAPKASRNQLLGEFILEGIEPAPRLEPKIEVRFAIDENGILSVSAQDQQSGVAQSIRVEDPLGLQQAKAEDLERMEREAEAAAAES